MDGAEGWDRLTYSLDGSPMLPLAVGRRSRLPQASSCCFPSLLRPPPLPREGHLAHPGPRSYTASQTLPSLSARSPKSRGSGGPGRRWELVHELAPAVEGALGAGHGCFSLGMSSMCTKALGRGGPAYRDSHAPAMGNLSPGKTWAPPGLENPRISLKEEKG